jgi:hypothetical protein
MSCDNGMYMVIGRGDMMHAEFLRHLGTHAFGVRCLRSFFLHCPSLLACMCTYIVGFFGTLTTWQVLPAPGPFDMIVRVIAKHKESRVMLHILKLIACGWC